MKRLATVVVAVLLSVCAAAQEYVPSDANLKARQEFASTRLGIFLHWGIYAMYGQGEWYLQTAGLNEAEYSKAAKGFYPAEFNASEWVKAFKDAGAGYITFTSRHHDGFSMFKTAESEYNIVDGSPFGRDVVGELASACASEGLRFHLYYSILDWHRADYPLGETGHATGRPTDRQDYASYFNFMKAQVRELLTNYPNVGCLWFDGKWDHKEPGFDWRLGELYSYIHSIKDDCLIGNNHHSNTIPGEDIQMFERDLPGQNSMGWNSYDTISDVLPLETCTTMTDGSWGYQVAVTGYKSVDELVGLLVKAAAKNSNLLLNIGPQPDGNLPATALERLRGLGDWMKIYAPTVNGTTSTAIPEQPWGVSTRTKDKIYLHVLSPDEIASNGARKQLVVPVSEKIAGVKDYATGAPLRYKHSRDGLLSIEIPTDPSDVPDRVVEIDLR